MKLQIDTTHPIAVICEGESEKIIIETLLEKDLLLFSRNHLIEEKY
ncbi:hypothetical protein [Staphylococcus pettenkoferi]|nr:hypothetical protein [Staphylococcus pettenkoferi]EHM70882.1 hypothetical protein SEVCU012_1300 [Staphylococcus pettenkoferi VCU012]